MSKGKVRIVATIQRPYGFNKGQEYWVTEEMAKVLVDKKYAKHWSEEEEKPKPRRRRKKAE